MPDFYKTPELFGVAGSSSGTGVTFFSILLANYLCGVKNRKTAVLEWNDSGDFERIKKICCQKSVLKPGCNTFKILEVSFIEKAGRKELLECINGEFNAIVIDFGSNFERIREEFLRCGRKILLGSLCEWKVADFLEIAVAKKGSKRGWEFLNIFGDCEAAYEAEKRLKLHIRQVPMVSDAFSITEEVMAFFEGFLKC